MGQTSQAYVDATLGLVQQFWAPMVDRELREAFLWLDILTRENQNVQEIKGGDTLRISFLKKPTSTLRSIGTDADTFDTNILQNQYVDLVVNKRAVSAYEFEDLAVLQSQLEQADSPIRDALMADVKKQINDHIVSLISPSTASPDNTIASVSDFTLSELSVVKTRTGLAKWDRMEPWYLALDPNYNNDLLDELSASDAQKMGDGVSPIIEGVFTGKRLNFNIFEDNSLDADTGYAFMPSFMRLAVGAPRFKLSDLHAQKKFGFLLSVDMPVGAKQVDDKKVISIAN